MAIRRPGVRALGAMAAVGLAAGMITSWPDRAPT